MLTDGVVFSLALIPLYLHCLTFHLTLISEAPARQHILHIRLKSIVVFITVIDLLQKKHVLKKGKSPFHLLSLDLIKLTKSYKNKSLYTVRITFGRVLFILKDVGRTCSFDLTSARNFVIKFNIIRSYSPPGSLPDKNIEKYTFR